MNDKSVLVINTPNNCSECPCCYVLENGWGDFISARCQMKYKGFVDKYSEYNKGRPSWCPLRPLPEKKVGDDLYERYGSWTLGDEKEASYRVGFNDCIDYITGETE